jgi:hypothetical protein
VKGVSEGLIVGYLEGLVAFGPNPNPRALRAASPVGCVPDKVSVGQMGDVVQKYLNDNPAERHKHSTELVSTAMRRAFPCKP